MRDLLRNGLALCCLGWATLGVLVPGCTSRLGPVRATQNAGTADAPNLPDGLVERAKECVADDAQQMAPGRIVFPSTVEVDEDGYTVGVSMDGIAENARDLGACLRNVLREMPMAEAPLQEGVERLQFHRKHASDSEDALAQFIEVIRGVPIVESELVLEAEGYTVVLPVTVKVAMPLEVLWRQAGR